MIDQNDHIMFARLLTNLITFGLILFTINWVIFDGNKFIKVGYIHENLARECIKNFLHVF